MARHLSRFDRDEGLRPCPFYKRHFVSPRRYQLHIYKCPYRKAVLASGQLIQCPFDYSHYYPPEREEIHFLVCERFKNSFRQKVDEMTVELAPQSESSISPNSNSFISKPVPYSAKRKEPKVQQPFDSHSKTFADLSDRIRSIQGDVEWNPTTTNVHYVTPGGRRDETRGFVKEDEKSLKLLRSESDDEDADGTWLNQENKGSTSDGVTISVPTTTYIDKCIGICWAYIEDDDNQFYLLSTFGL